MYQTRSRRCARTVSLLSWGSQPSGRSQVHSGLCNEHSRGLVGKSDSRVQRRVPNSAYGGREDFPESCFRPVLRYE